jgi:hypothetical protein
MEQDLNSEADNRWAGQEFVTISYNPKVYSRGHKSPSYNSVLTI